MFEGEFKADCNRLLAAVAVEASDKLTIERRIMLFRAVTELFPDGSQERTEAAAALQALVCAEQSQLRLTKLLK